MKSLILKWLGLTASVVVIKNPEQATVIFHFDESLDSERLLEAWNLLQEQLHPANVALIPKGITFHQAVEGGQ